MTWTFEFASDVALQEVQALPDDMRAKLIRIGRMIESSGLAALREPHVKHLEDKLWEIRLSGRSGIARALYVTMTGQRVVVLRTFVKKTPKTPPREIALALERARDVR